MLLGIWYEKPSYWNKVYKSHSIYLQELVKGFQEVRINRTRFIDVHKKVHELIYKAKPNTFPNGMNYASVHELVQPLLPREFDPGWIVCSSCH